MPGLNFRRILMIQKIQKNSIAQIDIKTLSIIVSELRDERRLCQLFSNMHVKNNLNSLLRERGSRTSSKTWIYSLYFILLHYSVTIFRYSAVSNVYSHTHWRVFSSMSFMFGSFSHNYVWLFLSPKVENSIQIANILKTWSNVCNL